MTGSRLIAAVLSAAAITACSTPPPAAPVRQAAPTTTTTAHVPGADPAAWFDAYCGPMGVTEIARVAIGVDGARGAEAMKVAAVRWASTAAASDRKMADGLEKVGAMSSDVQNLHDRLVKSLRLEATGWDDVAGRLQGLAADAKFPERFQQVTASRGGNSDGVAALFEQIVKIPAYTEAFRANEVCSEWQRLAKGN
ncbi:hypothetical protein [Lentzea sp. CA-135723]|uniref:hypothetical protein n=1 Tax=Lentzea sp. CA-135723 TaxID=3239950 RepID=UPI003D903F17